MPFSTAATDAITRRAPKFISPKAHAVIDYLMIGTFFVTGALFWRRNRRAAISALMCGSRRRSASHQLSISSQNRLRSRRHDGHHAGIHVFPRSS